VRGVFAQDIEELYQRMYKARQMITLGVDKRKWIELRRDLNKEVIALTKEKGYRAVPSVSVSELVATIRSAKEKYGSNLIDDFSFLAGGEEIVFIRGNYSSIGMLAVERGRLVFKSSSGVIVSVSDETDILFLLSKRKGLFSPGRTLASLAPDAEQIAVLEKIFGPNWENVNIDALIDFYLPDGYKLVTLEPVEIWKRDQKIMISGSIYKGNVEVGKIARTITADKVAEHHMLWLNENIQGAGFTKEHFRKLLRLYDELGITKIKCVANGSVGKYAWAKYGYDFASIYELKEMQSAFRSYIDLLADIGKVPTSEVIKLKEKIDGLQHSWEFADFTYKGQRLGKKFMLDRAPSWNAVLDLTPGSISRKILESYIGRR